MYRDELLLFIFLPIILIGGLIFVGLLVEIAWIDYKRQQNNARQQ
jgi:hypothetical protein